LRLPTEHDYTRVLVETNRMFLRQSRLGTGIYKNTGKRDPDVELERILATRGDRARKFRRIRKDFPIRSLPAQCAYLLRAFSGLQVFPDANHRSSFYFIRSLLWTRGIVVSTTPKDAAKLVSNLKSPHGRYFTGALRQNELQAKDEAYWLILDWFERRLRLQSFGQSFRYHFLKMDAPLVAWDWSLETDPDALESGLGPVRLGGTPPPSVAASESPDPESRGSGS
jgi:hypothetical protein